MLEAGKQPSSLILTEWVTWSLNSPDECDRMAGLQQILSGLPIQPFFEKLKEINDSDPSSGCSGLAGRLIGLDTKAAEIASFFAGDNYLMPAKVNRMKGELRFVSGTQVRKLIRKPPPIEILDAWRQELKSPATDQAALIGLSLLARFGKRRDAGLAIPFLSSNHDEIVMSALDLLFTQHPNQFRKKAAAFVNSDKPELRFHVLNKLRTLDPEGTLKFLGLLTMDSKCVVRQKALQILSLLPFAESSEIFFRFIAKESIPLLLVIAGSIVAFNPDPGHPMKIVELLWSSKGIKRSIIRMILEMTVKSIQSSGILTMPVDFYLKQLNLSIAEKRRILIKDMCIRSLNDPDPEIRMSAVVRLRDYQGDHFVFEKLRDHLSKETAADIIDLIRHMTTDKTERSENERRAEDMIQAVNDESTFNNQRSVIESCLANPPSQIALVDMIGKIGSFGSKRDGAMLLPFLRHQSPSVLAAAIRALGKLDMDSLAPFLTQFLKHANPRVISTALEVYINYDRESAVRFLRSMIESNNPSVRRQALIVSLFIDYHSIETLLMAMFKRETSHELKFQIGYMIASNCSIPGLEELYDACLEKTGGILKENVELWKFAAKAAVPRCFPNMQSLEEHFLFRDKQKQGKIQFVQTAAPRKNADLKRAETKNTIRESMIPVLAVLAVMSFLFIPVMRLFRFSKPKSASILKSPAPEFSTVSVVGKEKKTESGVRVDFQIPRGKKIKDLRRLRGSPQRLPPKSTE